MEQKKIIETLDNLVGNQNAQSFDFDGSKETGQVVKSWMNKNKHLMAHHIQENLKASFIGLPSSHLATIFVYDTEQDPHKYLRAFKQVCPGDGEPIELFEEFFTEEGEPKNIERVMSWIDFDHHLPDCINPKIVLNNFLLKKVDGNQELLDCIWNEIDILQDIKPGRVLENHMGDGIRDIVLDDMEFFKEQAIKYYQSKNNKKTQVKKSLNSFIDKNIEIENTSRPGM
jgi:hypothetical protein